MFVLIFPQRARHARGGRVAEVREAGEWPRCARQASGRGARGRRVAEVRESGAWRRCARQARGGGARDRRVAEVREAGEWRRCARRASGRGARGDRVAELREAGEWRQCASFSGYLLTYWWFSVLIFKMRMLVWQFNSYQYTVVQYMYTSFFLVHYLLNESQLLL